MTLYKSHKQGAIGALVEESDRVRRPPLLSQSCGRYSKEPNSACFQLDSKEADDLDEIGNDQELGKCTSVLM